VAAVEALETRDTSEPYRYDSEGSVRLYNYQALKG
jgi:hypothetical protein